MFILRMDKIVAYEANIMLPLKEKDDKFMQIQKLIDSKKQMLLEKQKKLKRLSQQNEFLEVVKDDYEKYYNHIVKQKQDQIKALQLLDEYIDDLTKTGELTKYNVEDAKEEQSKILREMNNIKRNIDNIINNTNDIQNNLNKKKNTI